MLTLPKLELHEPTLNVNIIEVLLPWLFWVQRYSRKQELEDILDRLEYVSSLLEHVVLLLGSHTTVWDWETYMYKTTAASVCLSRVTFA